MSFCLRDLYLCSSLGWRSRKPRLLVKSLAMIQRDENRSMGSRAALFSSFKKSKVLANSFFVTGVFRVFGFLLGSSLAGAAVYYYIFDEYKLSNELLTEDIYVRYCI